MLLKENYSLNLQWPANYKSLSLKILKKVAVVNCKERFREADALTSIFFISFSRLEHCKPLSSFTHELSD